MEINIQDYLSESEIKNMVSEEARGLINQKLRNMEVDTWVTNVSYKYVWKIIDEIVPDFDREIRDRVKKVIDDLSSYSVFKSSRDPYDRHQSVGQSILEEAVKEK